MPVGFVDIKIVVLGPVYTYTGLVKSGIRYDGPLCSCGHSIYTVTVSIRC